MKLKFKLFKLLALLIFSAFSVNQLSAQCAFECSGEAEYYVEILTLLPFNNEAQTVTVGVQGGLAFYQGDIILGNIDDVMAMQSDMQNGVATTNQSRLWPNSEIPFEISEDFLPNEIDKINAAAEHINQNSNLCVVPRTGQTDYVLFDKLGGCSSYVGKIGGGQAISLSSGCSFGSTVHEFLHAAGIYHEQSRADRDDHIIINWDNIQSGREINFEKEENSMDFGPYDFASIMHYQTNAFAINPQIPVITTIPPGIPIGQRTGLSINDIATLNFLYPEICEEIQEPDLTITFCNSINVLDNIISIHNLTVENIGIAEAGASSLGCYFSEDNTVDASDFKLAELQVPPLLPDGIFTSSLTINLTEINPPVTTGSYNILFYVNEFSTMPESDFSIFQEIDTLNNTCSHSSLPQFNITYGCKDETAHNYDPVATYQDNNTCETCTDGIKNGDEYEVDCGGSCLTTCECDNYTGTFFFQNCGEQLYYFIETDEGHIYDPYFPIDLAINVVEGQTVHFNYIDNNEVTTPCDVSEKPITITCLQIFEEDTIAPVITCPLETNYNICAPIAVPQSLVLQDFNATDNITPPNRLTFTVDQQVTHATYFTTYTFVYSISDEAGNTSGCKVIYNIANEFLQAPVISQPAAICQNEIWNNIKVGIDKYRIYNNDNNNPGDLLSICDSPVLSCPTVDFGVNTEEAGTSYFWLTEFIEFPNGEICESTAIPFSFTVHANPTVTLTETAKTIEVGEVVFLMDLVEDNKSGQWTGQNVLYVTDNYGNTIPYFTTNSPGITKLYYTVSNVNCTKSYSLIITVQNRGTNNKISNTAGIAALNHSADNNAFKIYPNPAKAIVNVEWHKNSNPKQIVIYNINGQLIQQFNVAQKKINNAALDVNKLEKGIYMIEVKSLHSNSIQKLLIE